MFSPAEGRLSWEINLSPEQTAGEATLSHQFITKLTAPIINTTLMNVVIITLSLIPFISKGRLDVRNAAQCNMAQKSA